ncbi:hypothetical protein BH09BAC2_BH09BAC2_07390 [soil metagenome]
MLKNFYKDDFESLIKEHADSFKMYPSKRTWHGIYNNFHPAKTRPSAAVTLLMIFSVIFVGQMNKVKAPLLSSNTEIKNTELTGLTSNFINSAINNTKNPESVLSDNKTFPLPKQDDHLINNKPTAKIIQLQTNHHRISNTNYAGDVNTSSTDPYSLINSTVTTESTPISNSLYTNEIAGSDNEETDLMYLTAGQHSSKSDITSPFSTKNSDKHSLLFSGKKNNRKLNWVYYVSPTLNYRISNVKQEMDNAQSAAYANAKLNDRMAMGFEVGSNILYSFSDNLSFVTGLQLNYSGYNILANTAHPSLATLPIMSEGGGTYSRAVSSISAYTNATTDGSTTTLHNYSFQASIPVGLQYRVSNNENFAVIAGATFQPSIVVNSNSFFLSGDKRSYMKYPSLVRDFNISTQFGTSLEFKSNNLKWQIGPEFRYQILSTYTNQSPYKEHLINYGLRLGISKKVK